jgi:hypothetical protein
MLNTPILFLIFNRPLQTQLVFQRIREAKPKLLYVAADGPREGISGEQERCTLAREIATSVDWDCEVTTLFRKKNLGCGCAVFEGINWFFENVEEGIILEDDCLVDLSFFNFASTLLEKYRTEEKVMHISAHGLQKPQYYLLNTLKLKRSYSFVQYPLIWGWATWKRAWKHYDFNMTDWNEAGEDILYENFHNVKIRDHCRTMFESVSKHVIDTWDYQWFYACLKRKGLSIYPRNNLVENIGFGPEATHTTGSDHQMANMLIKPVEHNLNHPKIIELNIIENSNLEEEVLGMRWERAYYIRIMNRLLRIFYRK